MNYNNKLWSLFEKLRSLAQTGINYSSDNPYHKSIYEQILTLCENIPSINGEAVTNNSWKNLLQELGVITPKVGSVVGVTRPDNSILILKRPSGRWCLPCGYADIGETPEATALREVREETGLEVNIRHFLGLTTTLEDTSIPFMWEAMYIAEAKNPENLQLSHEHLCAEWISNLGNRLWHSTHQSHARRILSKIQSMHKQTGNYFN